MPMARTSTGDLIAYLHSSNTPSSLSDASTRMISPDPSVILTQQLEQIVDIHTINDWDRSGAQVYASTFSNDPCMQEPGGLGRSTSLSDAGLYPTLVEQAGSNVAFGMEDQRFALSKFGFPFTIDPFFPPMVPAQDSGTCIFSSPENFMCLELPDDTTINRDPQPRDDVPEYCIPSALAPVSTPYTINSNHQTLYGSQDTEESLKTAGSHEFLSVEIPSRSWGSDQPTAHSWAENPSEDLSDPAAWIDKSSCLVEKFQVADFEAARIFLQQCISFEGPVSLCGWKDETGAICGYKLTSANLPEHLSEHGIKRMSRARPTKCNWVGCKRKTTMNRESIVRHIREVHLHFKRPSKRA